MKQIERYIQFAIDNELIIDGNKVIGLNKIGDFKIDFGYFIERGNNIELITSKPFIEAVARGICYKKYGKEMSFPKLKIIGDDFYIRDDKKIHTMSIEAFIQECDYLTTQQAIAIRDDKLEEFIINLLG